MHRITAALAAVCLLAGAAASDEQPSRSDTSDARMQRWMAHPQRTARAVRAEVPPRLDGVIDDEVWQRAPVQEGFTQTDPDNGEPSSLPTTFQVAYDDEALYFAAICYDTRPDSITARLTRRDQWRERDLIEVSLDPHHDHQTGVYIAVGPSGWIEDGIVYHDDEYDDSWDGVVEARTARRADGWSLELKIPYHVLRFGRKETYTWGINVARKIARRAEWRSGASPPGESKGTLRASAIWRGLGASGRGAAWKSSLSPWAEAPCRREPPAAAACSPRPAWICATGCR